MMEIIMRMSRGRGIADGIGSMNTIARTQWVTNGLVYNPYHLVEHTMPEASTLHCPIPPMVNILHETRPPLPVPIPFGEVYTYPYIL